MRIANPDDPRIREGHHHRTGEMDGGTRNRERAPSGSAHPPGPIPSAVPLPRLRGGRYPRHHPSFGAVQQISRIALTRVPRPRYLASSIRTIASPRFCPDSTPTMKKILTRWPATAVLLLALQACATAANPGASPTTPLGSRTVITAEEIEALRLPDLHSVVRTLHPEWLRATGGEVGVFVDGVRRGGPEVLTELSAAENVQVRYLDERAIRELSQLSARGLATAILVEEGAQSAMSSTNTFLPGMPANAHLSLAVYPQFAVTSIEHPFAGEPDYTLDREIDEGAAGVTAAVRFSYYGVYVQPFYMAARRTQGASYQHPFQQRTVQRQTHPRAGLMVGYEHGPLRAGVGVVHERTRWSWSGSACECINRGDDLDTHMLPIAEVAARLPLWRGLGAELRVTGRQRPDTEIEIPQFIPAMSVEDGGTEIDVALGLSARLF